MITLKQVAESLATELGPSHRILSSYAMKQTPQRTMPLLQLIELYVKVKGEQRFIENYHDKDSLYKEHGGFLERSAQCNGRIQIQCSFDRSIIARGQI